MIRVTVNNRGVQAIPLSPVTVGAEGIVAAFLFSDDWAGLAKTAIFKGSGEEVEKIILNNECTVPPEVLTEAGEMLMVGVYGNDGHGTLIRPTVWGVVGRVEDSAISEDAGQTGTTPSWAAQVQNAVQEVLISEEQREAAETVRDTAEEQRAANETARQSAEETRAAAEENRGNAEQTRITAEQSRVAAENSRDSAESARRTAEQSRMDAESGRVNAEASRASAEQERQNQEADRASNETARITAEENRASAEASRVTAENARATAESARASAETSRVSAEQSRVTAETARASAEDARATAENARVAAEQSRANAEASRVSAETARATEFATWENTIASKVPNTRTVNGKALSTDITLDAGDIEYDATETYQGGTVGHEVSELSRQLSDKITSPTSPASSAFLVWNGTAWVAQTLATWQGGSY